MDAVYNAGERERQRVNVFIAWGAVQGISFDAFDFVIGRSYGLQAILNGRFRLFECFIFKYKATIDIHEVQGDRGMSLRFDNHRSLNTKGITITHTCRKNA